MGKGLSELQKNILIRMNRNRINHFQQNTAYRDRVGLLPFEDRGPADITTREILVEFYEIPAQNGIFEKQTFNLKVVGAKKYHAAFAAATRTITRLVERGLATKTARKGIRGIDMTEKGFDMVQSFWIKGERI
jgi:hypothetical protein